MKTKQGRDLENYMAKPSPMSDERIANWWGKLGSRDLIIKHPIQSKKMQSLMEKGMEYQEEPTMKRKQSMLPTIIMLHPGKQQNNTYKLANGEAGS